jgi:hypothetical protein
MEQIIYKVNDINYMLFSMVCKTSSQADKINKKIEKFNGIIQSYDIKESFWNGILVKIKVLIPEQNAILFSRSEAE